MTQPMNTTCSIAPQGKIDEQAGEFWVNNPFDMLSGQHNFSAYESNRLLLNRRGKSFVDLSYQSGANIDSDSRSAIAADFDRDGDLDLLVGSVGGGPVRLFTNQIPHSNHRVRIDLRGTASNRKGIGARVIAEIGGERIVRDIFPANGFMGQSPAELILGTGDAETIDRLTIRWPTGKSQTFTDVPADCVIGVTEGEDTLVINDQTWLPTSWNSHRTQP